MRSPGRPGSTAVRRGSGTACPSGSLGVWSGPDRSGTCRLIAAAELHGAVPVLGRTVQNRTGRPVSVSDGARPIATLTDEDAVLELPSSRPLTVAAAPRPLPAAVARSAYPVTMMLPAIRPAGALGGAAGRQELAALDRRLDAVRARLAPLPGDLDRLAAVPLAAFRRQAADLLGSRETVQDALDELLASATHVRDADVSGTAAPLQDELRVLDAAYGRQLAALDEVEAQLRQAAAAQRLGDASARARQIAGRSAGAAVAPELWQPVDGLADALRGLAAGFGDLDRTDRTDRTDPAG